MDFEIIGLILMAAAIFTILIVWFKEPEIW